MNVALVITVRGYCFLKNLAYSRNCCLHFPLEQFCILVTLSILGSIC